MPLMSRMHILGHARSIRPAEEGSHVHMATTTKRWTLEEVSSIPDDDNTYELIHGELFVTPAAGWAHDVIAARLDQIIVPYVAAHDLGLVFHPRSVFRIGKEVQIEPDLQVRHDHPDPVGNDSDWETAPRPILVVEILSPGTRRRDFGVKRHVYIEEARIPEYWIVDGDARTIRVIQPGREDVTAADRLTWAPAGASDPLIAELDRVFGVRDR
jgi:Uma2 family endonuclease